VTRQFPRLPNHFIELCKQSYELFRSEIRHFVSISRDCFGPFVPTRIAATESDRSVDAIFPMTTVSSESQLDTAGRAAKW